MKSPSCDKYFENEKPVCNDPLMAYDPIKKMVSDYRYRARLSGYRFDFTYSEFKALVTSPCWYCGGDPEPRVWTRPHTYSGRETRTINYNSNGIDRIDSNFGYSLANCVSCCMVCNTMKNTMESGEFVGHLKKILSNFVR